MGLSVIAEKWSTDPSIWALGTVLAALGLQGSLLTAGLQLAVVALVVVGSGLAVTVVRLIVL